MLGRRALVFASTVGWPPGYDFFLAGDGWLLHVCCAYVHACDAHLALVGS